MNAYGLLLGSCVLMVLGACLRMGELPMTSTDIAGIALMLYGVVIMWVGFAVLLGTKKDKD